MTCLQDDHITSKASCCCMLRSVLIECCLHRTSATWRSHECYQQARKPESSDTPTASPTMCKNANVVMVYIVLQSALYELSFRSPVTSDWNIFNFVVRV